MIADPSSDFAPHSRLGALEQCSLTLIGASLNSPESSALYQNSVLRKFCSSRQKFSCRQKFCKACRQKFSSSRKYLRRFFYYVFHIQCQKYLFTDLNLPCKNSKKFFTFNDKNNQIKTSFKPEGVSSTMFFTSNVKNIYLQI